ncbi:MAG: cytochrome c3 family protein [bacterium]
MKKHLKTSPFIAVFIALAIISLAGCGGGKSASSVMAPTDESLLLNYTPFQNESPDEIADKDAADIGAFDADPVTTFSGGDDIASSGADFEDMATCANCHSDTYNDFLATGHNLAWSKKEAMFQAYASSSPYCLMCHTVTGPFLDIDGDHVLDIADGEYAPFGLTSLYATATGEFGYPPPVSTGTFTSVTDIDDELKGIQCENCHGPAGLHDGDKSKIVTGYQAYGAKTCDYCHSQNEEWVKSGHAVAKKASHGSSSCTPCHNAEGFVEYAEYTKTSTKDDIVYFIDQGFRTVAGGDAEGQGAHNINCAACHDPHEKSNEYQLRLPPEELCITCHKGRKKLPSDSRAPHHNLQGRVLNGQGPINTDGEMLWNTGGKYLCSNNEESSATACGTSTYYKTVATTIKPVMGDTTCVDCHMYTVSHQVYGHTFKPRSESCLDCHSTMDAANVIGIIQGDFKIKYDALLARAKLVTPTSYGDDATKVSCEDVSDAAKKTLCQNVVYNLKYLDYDGSKGIHNKDLANAAFEYTDSMLKSLGY